MQAIAIGDRVRSYDFDRHDLTGERACYVEGTVEAVGVELDGCSRYRVRVERDVFGGIEQQTRVGDTVYPPVNGTPRLFGGDCDFVERI